MSRTNLKPPESSNSGPSIYITPDTSSDIQQPLSRTPRPYSHDGHEILQHVVHSGHEHSTEEDGRKQNSQRLRDQNSEHYSAAGSESGTEADDERPTSFTKALPAPNIRPRKGLKAGEINEDALLTPSQIDDEGRRLSQGYFRPLKSERASQEDIQAEQEKLQRRRFAEFLRRTSEVALMGAIIICVLCGRGVLRTAWIWKWELLSHVLTITTLVLAYPIKLSIVDTRTRHNKFWQRFRVPASFDPATVLYPPFLPVLVGLSVASNQSDVVLPNIILGLSSLPQRLFPRSSRLSGVNAVHWLVSITPLAVSDNTTWISEHNPPLPYMLKSGVSDKLPSETLVLIYLLHHALLQPLHYLTTSSLLISELHLLSAALINVLLLAESPQTMILKSCLWIGGVSLFLLCGSVLNWNVTLARIPKWKLRRPNHMHGRRKSMADTVTDWMHLRRAITTMKSGSNSTYSDSDEFETLSLERKELQLASKATANDFDFNSLRLTRNPSSTAEKRHVDKITPQPANSSQRLRSNTLPERMPSSTPQRQTSKQRNRKRSRVRWYLDLTQDQAKRRKWLYAIWVYLIILIVVLIPVRIYVAREALHHYEPIGWAVSYLFGQLHILRIAVDSTHLNGFIPLPGPADQWSRLEQLTTFDIDTIRDTLGEANVRLLLAGYWATVLLLGLLTVFSLTASVEVDTRRKVFHGVMVVMLLPATFIDPCYCALALILALVVFVLLEVIRGGQVPPLSHAIGSFVAPYVDGRDLRGPIVVSHIFLLIGCAVPLWFSLASIGRSGDAPWMDWELTGNRREVAMISGVVCVGMGDAAASLIGRRYGRRKWIWIGGKSLEGSAAFALAVVVGIMAAKAWLVLGGWSDLGTSIPAIDAGRTRIAMAWGLVLLKAVICACAVSFMEAILTGANDNVVVPVALWLLVKGLRL